MTRPLSIVNFERCYLGALLVAAVNSALNWQRMMSLPAIQQAQASIGTWYVPVTTALGFLIPLVLWVFAARRASVVAKWIVGVLFGLGALGFLFGLAMGTMAGGLGGVLSVISFVLNAIAVWLLFKPDARLWFGEQVAPETTL